MGAASESIRFGEFPRGVFFGLILWVAVLNSGVSAKGLFEPLDASSKERAEGSGFLSFEEESREEEVADGWGREFRSGRGMALGLRGLGVAARRAFGPTGVVAAISSCLGRSGMPFTCGETPSRFGVDTDGTTTADWHPGQRIFTPARSLGAATRTSQKGHINRILSGNAATFFWKRLVVWDKSSTVSIILRPWDCHWRGGWPQVVP